MEFFTICAQNYAPQAAALGESIRAHHPDSNFTVWLIQDRPAPPNLDGVQTRDVAELYTNAEYFHLTARYILVELCTAVKPRIFATYFEQGAQQVVYLDPDIYLFQPLDEVKKLLDSGASGVLTPHSLTPLPSDGCRPDDLDILMSGTFNLGFLALSATEESRKLVKWWQGWLWAHCSSDHTTGEFTDQKWLNFAPTYWPGLQILRDTGYNVAYWNLHERPITGNWMVNGRPLVFFHFSGFSARAPEKLSKYQDRFQTDPDAPLGKLLAFYQQRLVQNGWTQADAARVVTLRMSDGAAYDRVAKSLYMELAASGREVEDAEVRHYLHEIPPDGKFPRYIDAVFKLRPDVQAIYQNLNVAHIVNWLIEYGMPQLGLDPVLVDSFKPLNFDELLTQFPPPPDEPSIRTLARAAKRLVTKHAN